MKKRRERKPPALRPAGAATPKWACSKGSARAPEQPPSADAILSEKYRQLARRHLERLPALFRQLTGLECSLSWAPSWPHLWNEADLPTHSPMCRRLLAGDAACLARCRRCAAQCLALTLKSGHHGYRFTCFRGVHNYWLPIIIRRCTVGLAFVQAFDHSAAKPFAGREHSRMLAPGSPARSAYPTGKQMNRADFHRAARLSQLIFQHVETSTLAGLRKSDLTQAQRALLELQTVATRLREELNGLAPAFNQAASVLQTKTQGGRIVQVALDYVHQHYAEPMTLHGCAGALRLNASYLSTLFARSVGSPFKTYLTAFRLEKARLLLNDPARNISEVAGAVGYASENCFRLAFKKATGLAPRLWRETFVAVKLLFLGCLLQVPDCLESAEALLL